MRSSSWNWSIAVSSPSWSSENRSRDVSGESRSQSAWVSSTTPITYLRPDCRTSISVARPSAPARPQAAARSGNIGSGSPRPGSPQRSTCTASCLDSLRPPPISASGMHALRSGLFGGTDGRSSSAKRVGMNYGFAAWAPADSGNTGPTTPSMPRPEREVSNTPSTPSPSRPPRPMHGATR
jgi:hypothetical protein